MITHHLRRHAVAYLALIVALSTGTAYAAGLANGSVTNEKLAKNAVTSSKIKKEGVKSSDIRDRTITATDIKAGVVPLDAFVSAELVTPANPTANPEVQGMFAHNFTLPRAGTVYLRFFGAKVGLTCAPPAGYAGLTLDGVPVPGTRFPLQTVADAGAIDLVALTDIAAGPHELTVDGDCPDGNLSGVTGISGGSWTVMLVAE